MPKEQILAYFSSNTIFQRQNLHLIMQIGPMLKGKKMACILVMDKSVSRRMRQELQSTHICWHPLCQRGNKDIVFLYRSRDLKKHLSKPKVLFFLKEYGYEGRDFKEDIGRLKDRVERFYERDKTFPHEIGVWLGYPLEDVRGFIENQGKNCLCCGYWKVYSNVARARRIFQSFDRAKDDAMRELMEGKKICEIAG